MKPNEYQKAALRTAGDNPEDQLANWVMGITGEAGELLKVIGGKKEHVEEMGDLAWYIAVYAHCKGIQMDSVINKASCLASGADDPGRVLWGMAFSFIDEQKKILFHGHQESSRSILFLLAAIYSAGMCFVEKRLSEAVSECEIFEGNIEKLKKRYPDGFSSEKSKSRQQGRSVADVVT